MLRKGKEEDQFVGVALSYSPFIAASEFFWRKLCGDPGSRKNGGFQAGIYTVKSGYCLTRLENFHSLTQVHQGTTKNEDSTLENCP